MKTNHRRGCKAKCHTDNAMWHRSVKDPLSGTTVSAGITNDFSNGRRGEAQAKRGAKKFLNSRIRARQKSTVRKQWSTSENEKITSDHHPSVAGVRSARRRHAAELHDGLLDGPLFHFSTSSSEMGMQISALVISSGNSQQVSVATNGSSQSLQVPAKPDGKGSAVNGGEFLMLALATCYCNDLYREALRMGISLTRVEVEANAEFAGIGLAARNIQYRATVESSASPEQVSQLIRETDAVAEVHNTIRAGVPVVLALS